MSRVVCGGFALLVTFLAAGAAQAQELGISLNPYVGYYHFDESGFEDAFIAVDLDANPIYGLRVGLGDRAGWSIDLAYGRTGVEGELAVSDIVGIEDATISLYYGAVNWQLQLPTPLDVFLSGGLGALHYGLPPHVQHPLDNPRDHLMAPEGRTDLLANYGLGVMFPVGRLRLRADIKDHVDLCKAPESGEANFGACRDDETLQNIELSSGIEIGL